MTQETAEILRKAKAHISDPKNWHQGDLYASGLTVKCEGDKSCACVIGAMYLALGGGGTSFFWDTEAMRVLKSLTRHGDVAVFNDHPDTTHADIMALFDRAIAKAEAAQ